ncbi:imidazole glycerol phosphate synthase subunit HisH [Sneathiella sp. P13V-1]|uniref:imidazole glycerol phosphate synthase subunit HisH n=1 Tax=Sneathiella sp. P13V-1 TaxID=2697366 RepID=UPI00187B1D7F|nr:imidazole glycerol phosphate synthase subunit HisH [Sneathiella sp. P13V-1]MBE7635811.1 imidazole glycerol phosphate synthase subunit HisH [Sneathiella sp. P13V-1]
MMITIIDYGSGNLRSAAKAFERAALAVDYAGEVIVTSDPEVAAKADRIVLPGVGAYKDCRQGLDAVSGMYDAIEEAVQKRGIPFFGICVGMQLMATRGVEHGITEGFNWIEGDVVKLEPADKTLKIPHMGWNELEISSDHILLDGINPGAHVYFVHSYHMQPTSADNVLATVDYAGPVTAIVGRDNMIGTQFHPEKSQEAGLRLIGNFLNWKP